MHCAHRPFRAVLCAALLVCAGSTGAFAAGVKSVKLGVVTWIGYGPL